MLNGGGLFPGLENTQVLHVAIALIHAGNVDFIIELHDGRLLGVLGPAFDWKTVDASIEVGLLEAVYTL